LQDIERARDLLAGSFVIPSSSFDNCFLTIVHGSDFSSPNFCVFIAQSPEHAEVPSISPSLNRLFVAGMGQYNL
jgi:hypothetical protein